MKLLLDECITNYLKSEFTGHEIATVEEAGFKGLKNGQLLEAASGVFDVLVTVDQNLRHQQNLENFSIAILVLKAGRSTYADLKPLIPQAIAKLEHMKSGEITFVS